jgi:hypothetical protein
VVTVVDLSYSTVILIILNFYVGLLLYSLPIPSPARRKGVRWAGRTLMQDSYSAVVVISVALAFVLFWNLVSSEIFNLPLNTASLSAYSQAEAWMSNEKTNTQLVGVLLNSIPLGASALDRLPFSFGLGGLLSSLANSFLAPWLGIITAYILTLNFLGFWVSWIGPPGNAWALMLYVGAFMYSFPFRVGRIAGSWFIAVPIAYIVAFPFMPMFVDGVVGNALGSIQDELRKDLQSAAWSVLFQSPPHFDVNTILSLLFALANPGTSILLRLVMVLLYVGFITTLSAGIASAIAGTSPPAMGTEPG